MALRRSVADILREPGREWRAEAPASEETIARLRQLARIALPPEYVELLRFSHGGEGPLNAAPLWFMLHTVDDTLGVNRMWADMGAYQDLLVLRQQWRIGSNRF